VTHLGDRAAAFVDGQLSPDSAERTTAHLVTCRPCRDLVELERLTKARLSALCGPEPTADLVGRLLAMGGPAGPLPPRRGYVPGSPRPQPVTMPAPHRGGVQVLRRSARPEQAERIRVPERPQWMERTESTTSRQRDVPRPGQRREPATSTRPSGRPRTMGARPSRLAAAVLGALSVVGVGVAGVAAGSTAAASGPTPVPQRPGAVVDPATAGFITVRIAPIEWTQRTISSGIPVERAVARR
jgi:anti-sigma factor RsiW